MTHYGQEVRDAFFLSELIELDSSSKNGLLYTVLSNSKKEKKKQCLVKHETKPDPDGKQKTIGNRKSDLPQKKKGDFSPAEFFSFSFILRGGYSAPQPKLSPSWFFILYPFWWSGEWWTIVYVEHSLSLSLSAVGHFTLYSKLINTSSSSR